MSCELCGGGDQWIKTCLTPEGSRLLVCDLAGRNTRRCLTIVPGDWIVTARCDSCGTYGNPREFSEVSLGGAKAPTRGCARRALGRGVDGREGETHLPPG